MYSVFQSFFDNFRTVFGYSVRYKRVHGSREEVFARGFCANGMFQLIIIGVCHWIVLREVFDAVVHLFMKRRQVYFPSMTRKVVAYFPLFVFVFMQMRIGRVGYMRVKYEPSLALVVEIGVHNHQVVVYLVRIQVVGGWQLVFDPISYAKRVLHVMRSCHGVSQLYARL